MDQPLIILTTGTLFAVGIGMAFWFGRVRAQLRHQEEAAALRVQLSTLGSQLSSAETTAADSQTSLTQERQQATVLREEKARLEQRVGKQETLETELEQSRTSHSKLEAQMAALSTELKNERTNAAEKIELLTNARAELTEQFQNLANTILETKSKRFTDQNKENINALLSPLKEQIQDFRKRVEDVHNKDTKDRVALHSEIVNMQKQSDLLRSDAQNLTQALRGDSKTQGCWGELVLERVLEGSGLREGIEYEREVSLKSDTGARQRPDVIVHLPDGKDIIIDAKVSLTAYERYCSADHPETQQKALKEHIASIKTHITQLSGKNYEHLPGVRTLDLVLMFVPIESAYILGIREQENMFLEALDKNIVLVCPSTLLTTLRAVESIWRNEQRQQNAQKIAKRAALLYDEFVRFVTDLESVGDKLGAAQTAYDAAHRRLSTGRGNLVKRTQELKELGVKSKKELAPELVANATTAETPKLVSAT